MDAIQGTVSNGQIVLDNPVELSDGTRVEVLPIDQRLSALGMREEEWPTTREGIAALLARMDQAEPVRLSPEQDAAWRRPCATRRPLRRPDSSRTLINFGECGNDAVPVGHWYSSGLHQPPPRRLSARPRRGRARSSTRNWRAGPRGIVVWDREQHQPRPQRRAAAGAVLPDLIVWPFTEQAAEAYGRIAADLRRKGRPDWKVRYADRRHRAEPWKHDRDKWRQ